MMMINNITSYQGLQNALLPADSRNSGAGKRAALSSGQGNPVVVQERESNQAPLLGIAERVNSLQNKWNLNEVQDPPFFPIATYQRMELISEVRNIQGEIERSSLRPELKQAIAARKLKSDATDHQIANVLDKMLSLRDSLSHELAVSKSNIKPGSILKLDV
jgi:hypothetical protein